jgi:hypothetical protein
MLLGLVDSTKG